MIGFASVNFNPVRNRGRPSIGSPEPVLQLLTYTAGDASEALQWMNELDREHGLTDNEYSMGIS